MNKGSESNWNASLGSAPTRRLRTTGLIKKLATLSEWLETEHFAVLCLLFISYMLEYYMLNL